MAELTINFRPCWLPCSAVSMTAIAVENMDSVVSRVSRETEEFTTVVVGTCH